ncbi:restriction endonuclease subunit S [Limosilactobacillus reuteri]|uniref:restriction endonuclease subunit S n=1 Tax=Limosilactobacillus reuteri TaxID=1598 RepID=UPI0021BB6298|nr:restriction endonuclease subunit S [Limosilactobacillus reuteri]UXE90368.1 restriction endonuclease subunit S [Limosilactobacillus reuteri]
MNKGWEQHKLGGVAKIIGGGTPNTKIPAYWNGTINWYTPVEIGKKIYINESQRKITLDGLKHSSAKLLPKNSVLFTSRAGIGKMAILGEEATTNQGFQSIIPIAKELDSYFLFSLSNQLKYYGETHGAGSTFTEISGKELAKFKLILPKLNEQKIISKLIMMMDKLISLQQRKLNQLKRLKRAMLQQLFVDKNCKQPILRFKNFNDNWEERKLSDIANYRNGKAHEQYIDMNGIYTVVNSKFISTNGKVKKFSNKPIELLKKGEIAFVLSDVPNGKALAKAYLIDSDNRYSLNQRIAGITPSSDINSYFLYILMNRNRYFLKFDDGVGQTNLSKKDIEEFKENYPLFDEQQKIANLFSKIQILITLQQNKLTQLTTLKKYLLQKLFI